MTEEKGIAPKEETGIITPEMLDDVLEGTENRLRGPLDTLMIFRQGKEDYFKIGEEKKGRVVGIFLMTFDTRAFWRSGELTGSPPDCHSLDGLVPDERVVHPIHEKCRGCPASAKGADPRCKTKAYDFLIVLKPGFKTQGEKAVILPDDVLGPGLLIYSTSNRGSNRAYTAWDRQIKEASLRKQGVVTLWSFGSDKSKGNIDYSFVKQEVVAPIPAHNEPGGEVWEVILKEITHLKDGIAHEVMSILTTSAGTEEDASE